MSELALDRSSEVPSTRLDAARFAVPVGRALFAAIFLIAGPGHFGAQAIGYAAASGVPLAGLAVPASGIVSMLGGLSILLGYRVRIGAALIALFLVPVTFMMHNFWAHTDPMAYQMHFVMFWKNLGLLGGALFLFWFGAGPYSLDTRRR
jgi:putative oxidoreductase